MGSHEITQLLHELSEGQEGASAALLAAVYAELRALARVQMGRLRPGDTLQPTALVHEAYLKLMPAGAGPDTHWEGRRHFFGAAAQAMRELIVDHVRRKSAEKRGGGQRPASLDEEADYALSADGPDTDNILAVDAALQKLERQHPRQAHVVVMRYFGGLTEPEIADSLGITTRTVERDWRFARAWLHAALA